MSFALRLYERFRVLIHEAAKFGVVGLAGFIVSLGGADVLRYGAGVGKYKAVVIATVLATVVTFIGNRYWAFRHRERTGMGRETVLFFVFNGIGLLIQLACVAIVQDGLNLQGKIAYNAANLVGIGLGTLFRFWSYRKWVWRTQDPAPGVQAGRHRPVDRPLGFRRPVSLRPGSLRPGWPGPSRSAWTRKPRCTVAARRSTSRGPGRTVRTPSRPAASAANSPGTTTAGPGIMAATAARVATAAARGATPRGADPSPLAAAALRGFPARARGAGTGRGRLACSHRRTGRARTGTGPLEAGGPGPALRSRRDAPPGPVEASPRTATGFSHSPARRWAWPGGPGRSWASLRRSFGVSAGRCSRCRCRRRAEGAERRPPWPVPG